MSPAMRKSGIAQLGEIPLGTHFCHFFEETPEVYDIAAPFLAAGLAEGELCLWLLAEPLSEAGAREALRALMPDADRQLAEGAVTLQAAVPFYMRNGEIDGATIDDAWNRLLGQAYQRGFTGVRIAGCVSWIRADQWPAFREYEEQVEAAITGKPIIVLCSYPLAQSGTPRILDAASTHQFALASHAGQTHVIETPVYRMRQLDVRNRRQVAISALGVTAVRERDLGVVMQDAASLAAHTLGTGRAIIWRYRPETGDLILHTSVGWDELSGGTTVTLCAQDAPSFALSSDQPVVVADSRHDTRFARSPFLVEHRVVSLLSSVVRGREQPWGLFSVHSMTPRSFDSEDIQFLQSMADVLALAIERKEAEDERASLLAQAETALAKLDAIERITDTALGRMGLDDLLAELLARLRTTLQADQALVLLLDEPRTHLVVRAVDGFEYDRLATVRVPLDAMLSGRAVREGKAMIFDSVADPHTHWTAAVGVLLRAVIAAPLVVEGKIIGTVTVTSTVERKFGEEELDLLRVVADRVAPAIERSRLTETVRAGRERLEALSRRLLHAQEDERRRVAIELHDDLGQILTAIRLNLASSPPNVAEAVESVDRAMQSVRDLALDLRPAMLDDLGLPAALRWYADRFARQTGVDTHLAVEELPRVDSGVATASFRVVQEALTNVARHASAKNVWLSLRRSGGAVELVVRDDGAGFDVAAASARAAGGASLGLIGMEERVSLAGGSLSVVSAPASGAEVRARFPAGGAA
ncbi:MAG TPA: MEDS domain-containing protein [Thermoanaerobaculia bacterium]|jgi:signal transduction histidine kinase